MTRCCCSPRRAAPPRSPGPGAGWTQIGRVIDGEITTVWRKVATAADAGSTVRLASGTTYVKVGADAGGLPRHRHDRTRSRSSPARPSRAAPTSHTSPSVANGTNGAWRVSYWSDKNSATTTWTAPGGRVVPGDAPSAAAAAGSSSLLTDSNAALTAGTPGHHRRPRGRGANAAVEHRDGLDDPAAARLLTVALSGGPA